MKRAVPLLTALLWACSCSPEPSQAQAPKSPTPAPVEAPIKVEMFASGLVHPWGLEFLPDGRALVTERPGRLRIVSWDGKLSPPLGGVPEVYAQGQGGLLVLTHRRLASRGEMVGVSGGWHLHLAILTDVLTGVEPPPFWSTHANLEAEYDKRIPKDAATAGTAGRKGENS